MEIKELSIKGCYLISPTVFKDSRGEFIKTFNADIYSGHGLDLDFKEEYYSVSHKGVLRGLHFQAPPHDHVKMVYCVKGAVFDAFVDLRKNSPTYKKHLTIELSEGNNNILILAKGIAHGFLSLEDDTLMIYKTSTVYQPQNDAGILWNSVDIKWPSLVDVDLISERDMSFQKSSEFKTPFN